MKNNLNCCSNELTAEQNERKLIITDNTARAGAKFSGSFNIFNSKTNSVDTIYIKEIIYNDPVTIVFWSDGSKTVSKAKGNDVYDKANGLIYCIIKKIAPHICLDTLFHEWLPVQEHLLPKPVHIRLKDIRRHHKKYNA